MPGLMPYWRHYNKNGEPVGILSLIGSDAAKKNSGLLVLLRADLLGILEKPSVAQMAKLDAIF